MKLSDFDYALPKEKIAFFPAKNRADARLLCVDKRTGAITHRIFRDLPELLKPTDVLVLNNTKVIPARIFGKRATGGQVEALLLKDLGGNVWESLLKPGGRVKDGEQIVFGPYQKPMLPPLQRGKEGDLNTDAEKISPSPSFPKRGESGDDVLIGTVMASAEANSGKRRIRFEGTDVMKKLHALGHIPLPPYIDRSDTPADRETYQTVYAEQEGAVASPTAGLHFDGHLLDRISGMGVEIAPVTLHVSYGTFQPITAENIDEHKMFEEEYEITEDSAAKINKAKREGRRVVVCGTTCVRALESAAVIGGQTPFSKKKGSDPFIQAGKASTSIFIRPPYEFRIVDALITNFHMPKSTLLVMTAAFLGYSPTQELRTNLAEALAKAGGNEYNGLHKLMNAYNTALKMDYRFASYGDAMFIS